MTEDELRQRFLQQQQEQEKALQLELQLDVIARKLLSPEAKARLNNVKLVNKEKYFMVIRHLVQLYQQGQFNERLSEERLKELLSSGQERKEFKIKRM